MLIVTNCKEQAVQTAKKNSKDPDVKLYDTGTGKYIITNQEQVNTYIEIPFRHLTRKDIKEMEEAL